MAGAGPACCMLGRMREISNIHAFEDERFLRACLHGSAVVLAACAAAGAALFFVLPAGGCAPWGLEMGGELLRLMGEGGCSVPVWILGLVLLCLAVFALHEGVHGALFKLLAPAGAQVSFGVEPEHAMLYACAEGIVYPTGRYIAILLGPTVVLTALLACIGVAGGYPLACFVAGALHLSGCVGDWFYVREILSDRRIVACEDTSWGVRFLGEGEDDGEAAEAAEPSAEALGEESRFGKSPSKRASASGIGARHDEALFNETPRASVPSEQVSATAVDAVPGEGSAAR